MTIALLPNGTSVTQLGGVAGLSPGLLSAGLGEVDPEQTYLDIGQGNRVFESLYDSGLPSVLPVGARVPHWAEITDRADSAPADIVPGLLASTLAAAGLPSPRDAPMEAAPDLVMPALLAADRGGAIGRTPPRCRSRACLPPVEVRNADVGELAGLVRSLRGRDLLIAFERPPPETNGQLAIAIAGAGFDGNLTSDSTRIDGYVLSTDIAPTVLRRFGIDVPSQIDGEPIRADGEPDVGSVADLGDRLEEVPDRRGPVIGVNVLLWLAALGLAVALTGGRAGRVGVRLFALSVVYLPLALLAGAALEASLLVERLLVLVGAPAAAALTLALAPGYRALAVACGLTTLAYAIDVIAGSPLTSLSLMGPDPGLGVRFYGIGNELEAVLAPLVVAGTGAALASRLPAPGVRTAATTFLITGFAFAIVFAAGRFGADVGAAIVFPAGAAVAAALIAGRRRVALLALAAPLIALAGLALIDLVSGGNAHLTRSVLDAGGLHELADVAERRLRLSAKSFGRAATSPFLPLVVIVLFLAYRYRRSVLGWLEGDPAFRAGFIGAATATIVGTLANDSGALILEVGTAYLLVFAGFAWAGSGNRTAKAV